jgi:purine-binding chemotaxis protein CheW
MSTSSSEESAMPSTQQLCTFFLQDQFFGIPVQQVQEVVRCQEMTRVPLMPDTIQGLINLRGQIVTAIDLRRRLGLPDRAAFDLPTNVVVRTEESAVSFLVDEIGDVLEVNETSFESSPETLRKESRELILGVYKLEERLLLVLNVERVIDTGRAGAVPPLTSLHITKNVTGDTMAALPSLQ